jgi:hypothetical protein
VLDAVVLGTTHQQRLPGKKVEGQQRRIMGSLDDGMEPALLQIPQGDGTSTTSCS